jgi:competence protein ComEC
MVAFPLTIAFALLAPAWLAGPALLVLVVLLPLCVLTDSPLRWLGQAGLGAVVVLVQLAFALEQRPPPSMQGRDLELVGQVVDLVESEPGRHRFRVVPDVIRPWPAQVPLPGLIRLTQYGGDVAPGAGERWRWTVRIKRPRGFRNPVDFDYESWLAAQHVDATGYVRGDPAPQRLTTGRGLPHWRAAISARLAESLPPGDATAVIQALVVGDRRGFDDRLWNVFRDTGTSHLMAISGLHIGLVAGLLGLLANLAWRIAPTALLQRPRRDVALLAGFAGALVYAALAGFSVSTLRALVMVGVACAALACRRRVSGFGILLLTASLVLASDPRAALSVGFWLSFSAVALILAVSVGRHRESRLIELVRIQWAVGIGMLPLTLAIFGSVSWTGLGVNLLAIPLFSLIVVPAALLGTLLLGLWPLLGTGLLAAVHHLLGWILAALERAAQADALFDLAEPLRGLPGWLPVGLAVLLVVGGWRPWIMAGLAALALAVGLLHPLQTPVPALRMIVFEVGQGTAVLVEAGGRRLLFDTGPGWSSGASAAAFTLVPYFEEQGIRRLDRVIVSHDDRDHSGGLGAVLDAVRVSHLSSGEPLAAAAARRCHAGQSWRWGAVEFRLLWPPRESELVGNGSSCVLEIRVGGRRLLLTGDIEAEAERVIAGTLDGPVDVLLVPHHGSASSSTPALLARARPRVAVIPVGHRNAYGFPDAAVLRRYHELGAAVYRTGRDGAVIVDVAADGCLTVTGWRAATWRLHHEPGGRGRFRRLPEIHYHADRSADPGRHLEPCGN